MRFGKREYERTDFYARGVYRPYIQGQRIPNWYLKILIARDPDHRKQNFNRIAADIRTFVPDFAR